MNREVAMKRPTLHRPMMIAFVGLVSAIFTIVAVLLPASSAQADATDNEYIYVPSVAEDTLSVISTRTGKVVRVEKYGDNPVVTATDPGRTKVFATNFFRRSLQVFDTASGESRRIPLPANGWALLANKDRTKLVIPLSNDTVVFFDTRSERIVKTIRVASPVPVISSLLGLPLGPISVELSPKEDVLYVGYGTGQVDAYRVADGKRVKPLISVQGVYPAWFSLSPDGKWLFSLNALAGDVAVFDTASWKFVKRLPIPLSITGKYSPDGKRIFFAGLNAVTAVDAETLKVVGKVPTRGIATSVVFSDDGKRGYFGTTDNGLLPPLDLAALGGLGQLTSLQRVGKVQEFNPSTYAVVGKPIPMDAVPGVIAGSRGWQ